jgi:hypothetical protein
VTLEIGAELFWDEADPLADAHRWQLVPFYEAMDLSTGDAEEH